MNVNVNLSRKLCVEKTTLIVFIDSKKMDAAKSEFEK